MLRIMEAMSGHVQEWLMQGYRFWNFVRHSTSDIFAQSRCWKRAHLIASPDNRSAAVGDDGIALNSITLSDCAQLGLGAAASHPWAAETVEQFANDLGIDLDVRTELDSLTNMKTLVSRGSGFSILALAAVVEELERKSLIAVPICDPIVKRTVYLVQNPSRPASQAVHKIERLILDITTELGVKGRWPGKIESADYKKAV
jgi:LysR family nitrogen assimilation transcriptional regulator